MHKLRLVYTKTAAKDIAKMPPQIKKRLKTKLEWFISQSDPFSFAQALTRPADAQYRFRIGNYRVLFDVEKNKIIVLHIQHRREIYRK